MICDYFRVTRAHDTVLDDAATLFSNTLRNDNAQEFDTRWNEMQLYLSPRSQSDDISGKSVQIDNTASLINSKL